MLVRVTDEFAASASVSRIPAASRRARLLVVLLRTGAFVPFTRFCEIWEPEIVPRAPATRWTPFWPNIGPSGIGFGSGLPAGVGPPQSPSTLVSQHCWRPTIADVEMTPRRSRPERVVGISGLTPASISTPERLYSSMRVLAIVRVRGPAPTGAVIAAVTWATP